MPEGVRPISGRQGRGSTVPYYSNDDEGFGDTAPESRRRMRVVARMTRPKAGLEPSA
jgi:hypothetical protein